MNEQIKSLKKSRSQSRRTFIATVILALLSFISFLTAFTLGVGPCSDGDGFLFLFAFMALGASTIIVGIIACVQRVSERRERRRTALESTVL